MNIKQTIINILSNPKTIIPDELAEYLFKEQKLIHHINNVDKLLELFPKKVIVEFAAGEAKLVLPMFETMFPDDSRPRDALAAAALWLSDHGVAADAAANDAYAAAYDAHDAAYAAAAAYARDAADAAAYAAHDAAYAAAVRAYARDAADAARAAAVRAYNAARAAANAVYAVSGPDAAAAYAYDASAAAAANVVDYARAADPSIILEDQIKRLFQLSCREKVLS